MLNLNKKYSGATIIRLASENDGNKIISVDGIIVRLPLDRINKHGVYSFTKNERGGITIRHHNDSWSCDQAVYNQMQNDGMKVLDNIFGDVFGDIKNIKK